MAAVTQIHGTDISSYQPGYSPASNDDFVFVKATEGTTYTNPYAAAQVARARAKGCVVGHYHYLHPGNPKGQAAYFVKQAPSQVGDILICDWERTSNGDPSCADKDAFLKEVARLRPGHKTVLYCNTYYWTSLDTTSFCGDGLWIAQYSSSPPTIKHPWLFWQYQGSPIDKNVAAFASRAALLKWAAGTTLTDLNPTNPDEENPMADLSASDINNLAAAIAKALGPVIHSNTRHAFYEAAIDFQKAATVVNPMGGADAKKTPLWSKESAEGYLAAWQRETKDAVQALASGQESIAKDIAKIAAQPAADTAALTKAITAGLAAWAKPEQVTAQIVTKEAN